jgi:plastocyanin
VLLAGVSGVAALGPVLWLTAQPAAAFAQKVSIVNFGYSPSTAPIKPGDKIIWVNDSNTKHTVTADSGGTAFDYTIGPGRSEELRFDQVGTYTYHCNIHSQMKGKIEVADPSTSTTAAPATTTTTAPPTTTTTAAPATTTTAEPTTTTTAPRPAAGPPPVPFPPVPNSSAAPPPVSSTTTSAPSTTTTAAPSTTTTSAPPAPAAVPPPPAPAPESTTSTSAGAPAGTGDKMPTAAGPKAPGTGDLNLEAVALVVALVAVGAFGGWTLIRVRPGRV